MQKIKLSCAAVNGGAFNCLPARDFELEPEKVLCNDVTFPWDRNGGVRLWVIGHEFGAVCAVWAQHEQDALDQMVDSGLGDAFLVAPDDYARMSRDQQDDCANLGNASEPADLTNAWLQVVDLSKLDPQTLCMFAEARGAGADNLGKV